MYQENISFLEYCVTAYFWVIFGYQILYYSYFKNIQQKLVTSTISLYDKCVVLYMYNSSHMEGNI